MKKPNQIRSNRNGAKPATQIKPDGKARVRVRMPAQLSRAIRAKAQRQRISVSQLAERAIRNEVGRPSIPKDVAKEKPARKKRVAVLVQKPFRDAIVRGAKRTGQSVSAFVIGAVREKVNRDLSNPQPAGAVAVPVFTMDQLAAMPDPATVDIKPRIVSAEEQSRFRVVHLTAAQVRKITTAGAPWPTLAKFLPIATEQQLRTLRWTLPLCWQNDETRSGAGRVSLIALKDPSDAELGARGMMRSQAELRMHRVICEETKRQGTRLP